MFNKTELIDISVGVDENSIVWPGVDGVEFLSRKRISRGDSTNDTDVKFNVHVGTHIDAPLHFLKGGNSVDRTNLKKLIGNVFVTEFLNVKEITAKMLQEKSPLLGGTNKILLKTDNSALWERASNCFYGEFCALTPDAARWLVDNSVEMVGNDYLSVQKFEDGPDVHQILLKAGVVILEGVDLSRVKEGLYYMVCLPVKLSGIEGAPARAVLFPSRENL